MTSRCSPGGVVRWNRSGTLSPAATFALAAVLSLASDAPAGETRQPDSRAPFCIEVIDRETRRGVPLVELRTTNDLVYVTDSQGIVAIDEPGLLGQPVFFHVASHGYTYPEDGFGYRGRALRLVPGGSATLEVQRLNIAERLYRVTGQGIYADTVRLGRTTPLEQPTLNGQVTGQDSVQAAVYQDRVYWFWGDTSRARYPLGHFATAGAVSDLPGQGGLDPSLGVDLRYFEDDAGFSRPMFRLETRGLVWTDAVFTLEDPEGNERLLCHYSVMQDLGTRLEHGLAVFDDERQLFQPVKTLADDERLYPVGHAFKAVGDDGRDYLYFANAYPLIRVPAAWDAVLDSSRYEGFTPLPAGTTFDENEPELERDPDGNLRYGWKRDTSIVDVLEHASLVRRGILTAEESRLRTLDCDSGEPIALHGGSVRWNAFRGCFVMIAVQQFGSPSFLGEVWYSESERPEGPWPTAVKIVTHDNYSFYNPVHHPFFDGEEGRFVYFEGTYSRMFSNRAQPTPRYDYNQIMYRLDLADERLEAAGRGDTRGRE